ncbi:FAD-dependent monooxygenase [Streptomyces sp. NPDC057638]|uniref:FAD-dependent monooxygenase n=1 Tax=Streptomyces sp. NPDC057638 TaxID=3346190 RepID=UPI0036C65584
MAERHVVVIGSGVGGLTAAVALAQRDWRVTVLERAPSLEPVGAGIGLAPNAQRALDVIGLGDEIRDLASWQGAGGLRAPGGRWLSRTDSAAVTARFGGPIVLIHRATLIERLASRLPEGTLRTGTRAALTDPGLPGARPARVTVATGTADVPDATGTADVPDATGTADVPDTADTAGTGEAFTADLVIGADGIHSATRRRLFPRHPGPRYTGFTTWRSVIPGLGEPFAPHETWGPGSLWGSLPLQDGRIYAYAAALAPEGRRADDEKAELRRRFGGWHHPVPEAIAAMEPERILRHDVHHLIDPLPAFHGGRTALVGDAAHAMTPNLGQGGNQAVEDAIVLAHHLGGDDLATALAAYSADRLPRTTAIVRQGARVARLVGVRSAPGVAVRAALMSLAGRLGPAAAARAFDGIADWRPPGPPYPDRAPHGPVSRA